jgi:hypothetical protein
MNLSAGNSIELKTQLPMPFVLFMELLELGRKPLEQFLPESPLGNSGLKIARKQD